MGLFDDAFGSSKPKDLTKQEAFAGILLGATASDGHIADEEAEKQKVLADVEKRRAEMETQADELKERRAKVEGEPPP